MTPAPKVSTSANTCTGDAAQHAQAKARLVAYASTTTREAHHVLDDGFARLGDLTLLAHLVGTRLAHFLGFSGDLHGLELVGFVAA
jgi:hypothetical protein